ncbi:MAG: response regulator transcription factor [Thiohalomonadaceae bacterium]
MRVLVVEDESGLRANLKQALKAAGYVVDVADNGVDAEALGHVEPYDAIVLDLGLPRRSGLDVLRSWRAQGNPVPVIILTARDAWNEKVAGFQAGCDDYLAKPFHMEELLVRLSALLRRASGRPGQEVAVGDIALDEERQTVTTADGTTHALTGTEFRLLRYFMLNAGKLLSKSRLTDHVYEYDDDRDSNVIEVYVNRLRQKLGREWIETRRGQGYIFRKPGP